LTPLGLKSENGNVANANYIGPKPVSQSNNIFELLQNDDDESDTEAGTSGNQAKQLATPVAQKWLTKEFAAGAKTGDRPDAHTTNPRS
jgi:hypothetical protein